jgi:hypothetical protein
MIEMDLEQNPELSQPLAALLHMERRPQPADAPQCFEEVGNVGVARRDGRHIPSAFPIEVIGFDPSGRLFTQRGAAREINDSHCRLELSAGTKPGDVVAIRLLTCSRAHPATKKPLLFEILWTEREGNAWIAGARILKA